MEYPFKDLLPRDEVLEREGYYKDWTHLDPKVFYSLTQISEYIKTKGFGVDVRLLIAQLAEHFGLKTSQINEIERFFKDVMQELAEDKDFYSLPEIAGARRGYSTLAESLGNLSVNMINKNLGKLDQTFMSEEFLQQIVGNTPINSVPADESVNSRKLANESVDGAHIKRVKNLFNPDGQINSGMRLNDGTVTPRSDVGHQRIWLNPNSTYYLSAFSDPAGVQFNSNGNPVGVVSGQLFTTTAETAFVDFNVNLTGDIRSVNNFMVVETNQAINTYKPYNQPFIGWLEDYINDVGIDGSMIKSNTVEYDSFKKKINLFDKNKVQSGYVMSDGTISPHQTLGYSHQIPLEPNSKYSIPLISTSAGALYDSEGNMVEYLDYNLGETFTTPSEVSYGVFNVNRSDSANILYIENYMVVPGNEYPQEYIRYGETVEWLDNYLDKNKTSKWRNKKIDIFGTSITWYSGKPFGSAHSEVGQIAYGHASAIESEMGAIVANHGISGGTFVEQIQNKVLSLDFKDTDAVILGGGVNDWYYGEPLGLVEPIGSTFDGSTTTGALQIMIEHILNSNPKVTLFLLTPLRAWFKDEYVGDLSGEMLPETYADMYHDVSALYGLPLLDLYNSSGVNDLNKDVYFGDVGTLGDRLIHPNNDLYRRLNGIILPFIERY